MKSLKTPLRYPGGKSRACTKMDPYFPDLRDYKEYREPFLGGGSVAIHVAKKYPHLNIWVNDLYQPLVNFWQQLQDRGDILKDTLVDLKTSNNTQNWRKNCSYSQRRRSMIRLYLLLIALFTSMSLISARSVDLLRVRRSHRRHHQIISLCVELKNCHLIPRLFPIGK